MSINSTTDGVCVIASILLGAALVVGKCIHDRHDFSRTVVAESDPGGQDEDAASSNVNASVEQAPQFRVPTEWIPPSYDLIAPSRAPSLGFDYEQRAIQQAEQKAYDAGREYSDQTAGYLGAMGGLPLDPGMPPVGGW